MEMTIANYYLTKVWDLSSPSIYDNNYVSRHRNNYRKQVTNIVSTRIVIPFNLRALMYAHDKISSRYNIKHLV
jgi:hypothetical protein